ncbi:MAG: CHASE2 domain-containing protein [Cyanothece sp. SIO1E1]|nr:CHASE2 domain-containing protein [Cyanothece sp. SIO1E1]
MMEHDQFVYQFGGSLPPDACSYVMRQADHDLFEALLAGTYCYVLNSRQMGKSSLRVRTVDRLCEAGVLCVEVELLGIGSQQITAAQWYGGIIQVIISSLGLPINRRSWLREHEDLSPVQRLGSFIEQVVLPQTHQPIVICFDEIDSVLGLSFPTDEFFGLIRNWYEKRATNPDYKRLTVVMLGVTTPSDLMQDHYATPFNIGRAIELQGFSFVEAQPLLPGLATVSSEPVAILKAILAWTGGQPFLTQKLCQLVTQSPYTSNSTPQTLVSEVVRSHLIKNWETQDEPEHLRTIRDRLLRNARQPQCLLRRYQQILKRGSIAIDNSHDQMELRLTGLVTRQQGELQAFNRIYQTVFDRAWVTKQLQALQLKTAQPPTIPFWFAPFTGASVAVLVIMVRLLGLLQPYELWALDQLMRWRPPEPADDRFLIISVSEADIRYQDRMGMARTGSLSDVALLQVLQKLEPYQPRVIGLDFYHDFPFRPELAAQLSASDRFIAACEIARTVDAEVHVSIAAPPGIPTTRVGFTDFPLDPDYVVRRQILGMPGTQACPTDQSLGLQIALHYLKPTGTTLKWLGKNRLQIDTILLPKLTSTSGGYRLPVAEQGGYQMLVNYRQHRPEQITLMDLLEGEIDARLGELVSDRIVLIGLADPKDAHFTSVQQRRLPGVVVHAHMASQIISAVMDGRPLIWWWPEWLELIWIGSWSLMGSVVVWGWQTRYPGRYVFLGLIVGGLLIVVGGFCYVLFLIGGWMPLVPPVTALVITSSSLAKLSDLDSQN